MQRALHTQRLFLRRFRRSDAAELLEVIGRSRAHLRSSLPWLAAIEDEAGVARLVEGFDLALAQRDERHHAIFEREGGALVGGVSLQGNSIGYWLDVAQLGRGYATEAAAAVVRLGFAGLGRDRLEILVAPPDNPASAAVADRLGFERSGAGRWTLARADFEARAGAPWRRVVARLRERFDTTLCDADLAEVTCPTLDGEPVTLSVRRTSAFEKDWLEVWTPVAAVSQVSLADVAGDQPAPGLWRARVRRRRARPPQRRPVGRIRCRGAPRIAPLLPRDRRRVPRRGADAPLHAPRRDLRRIRGVTHLEDTEC